MMPRPMMPRPVTRDARGLMLAAMCALAGSCTETAADPSTQVASIQLTPPTANVRAGGTVTLSARSLDANGNAVEVRAISWSTNNATIARVSSSGVVTALTPGDVRIAASAFGVSATANVTVTARVVASVVVAPAMVTMRVGVSVPLQARTLDVDGSTLTGRTVVWTSSNTAVATVNAQGSVTGVTPGAATITATSEGRTGQAAVTVTIPPVQTVVVSPTADTVAVGIEQQFTALTRDASGATLAGRAVAWSSSNVAVASVSSSGLVTGRAPGTANIAATSEGRVGTATVLVLARLADAVTVSPAAATLIVNATQQLTVQITDPVGNLLTGRPVTYTSNAPAIATVDTAGRVMARGPGTARITATSEGKSGVSTITVIPEPVAILQLTPATLSLLLGETAQLALVTRSAAGAVLTGRAATWTSGAPTIASVSGTGLVRALTPGVSVILVEVEGVFATTTVTVRAPGVASVVITPNSSTVAISGSVQLSATPSDASGVALTGRTIIWSSADESIAFVSSTGLVVGFKQGTVRITATVEGVSGTAIVSVR